MTHLKGYIFAELDVTGYRGSASRDAAAGKGHGSVNDDGVLAGLAHAKQARLIDQRAALIARHSGRAR